MLVLDTHALVWWVSGSSRLSARAKRELKAATARAPAIVPAISIFEIATAARRGRLELAVPVDAWLADVQSLPEVRIQPLDAATAALAASFGDDAPGDPADRMIAATAIALRGTLLTADTRLRALPGLRSAW